MAHTDRIGHGSAFHRSSDGTSAGTFSSVGACRDINPPTLARDAVESTDNESEDGFREYIGGLKDAGEVSFEITFDPASAETTAFMLDYTTATPGYYKIVFPDASEWGFAGLLTSYAPVAAMADKMTANVTYKLSGKPGWLA